MHKYEPKEFIAGNREEWRAEILKALQSLPKESNKLLRMSDYIEYLKSRCPLYQSTWIFVKVCVLSLSMQNTMCSPEVANNRAITFDNGES